MTSNNLTRPPPRPSQEPERMKAVKASGLYGTPAEERFDSIVRLARRALNVEYAAVNIIGDEALYAKSVEGGPPEPYTERDTSYCTWALADDAAGPQSVIIEDAKNDPRTFDNPWAGHFRFYAGLPVRFQEQAVAVLCVGGPNPRVLEPDELTTLRDLTSLVETEVARSRLGRTQVELAAELDKARERASIDGLTRVWSRTAIIEIASRELSRGPCAFLLVDVDHFKAVNDTHGHQAGDVVLRRVSDRIRNATRSHDAVGRYGGEEFLVVLPGCDEREGLEVGERIRRSVSLSPVSIFSGGGGTALGNEGDIRVTVSIGLATGTAPAHHTDMIVRGADEALYEAKRAGRNRVVTRRVTASLAMRAVRGAKPSDDG